MWKTHGALFGAFTGLLLFAPAELSAKPASHQTPAAGMVVEGERFTARQVVDPLQHKMPVIAFLAPEKWRDKGEVVWNFGNSTPVRLSGSVENPANEEAYFYYPNLEFFALKPVLPGYYKPGQAYRGMIYLDPRPPAATLLNIVQQARGGFPKFQVVGSKDLPGLPGALKVPPAKNQRGVGMKVTYELNGKPVEEEVYAVYFMVDIPYDGPQGRTWQTNWGLSYIHSFRAAAGTLNRRRPVFAAIAKSVRPNPAWFKRLDAINEYLAAEFNRQLQAGYDSIAAAGRLSQQISANNDAMIATIDQRLQAGRTQGGGQARSSTDKFDDYIRGVDTVDDPHTGTSQHASTEQYHWTDGYGEYRNTNDGSYDPNRSENGNWQLMKPTP